jgi:hypothetical protein
VSFGTVLGVEIAAMGDLLPYPLDAFRLVMAFVAFCTFFFIFVFCAVGIFLSFVSKKSDALFRFSSAFAIVFFQSLLGWIEYNRPVNLSQPAFLTGCLAIFILSLLLILYLKRLLITWQKIFLRVKFWLYGAGFYLIGMFITLTLISQIFFHTVIRKEPLDVIRRTGTGKVLLIGVDAADMQMLLPLVQAKKLPHFEKLLNEGASGDLPSLVSMYNPFANTITNGIKSAAVWNSILTGKKPSKHGIKDFIYTEVSWLSHPFRYPLLPSFTPARKKISQALGLHYRPYNRLLRKTKAAWNIFTDTGAEVATLGFWMTWPAEEINGENLSDRFDVPDLPMRWFPEQFIKQTQIDTLTALYHAPIQSDIEYFSPFKYDPLYNEKLQPTSRNYFRHFLFYNLLKSYYQDEFRQRLGLQLLQQHNYVFFALYLYGLDTAGHAFSSFKYPHLFPENQAEENEYFNHVIDRYYEWIDSVIGDYLNKIDDETTVVICSDHGMGPMSGITIKRADLPLSGSHRIKGMIILWGSKIRKGIRIHPKNLLDVLPTVLYLTGLPVARDMDGHVLTEAIDQDYFKVHPVEYVRTYETQRYSYNKEGAGAAVKNYDESTLQQLKALGYIK